MGLFIFSIHLPIIPVLPVVSFVAVFGNIDPFYYVLELILPSPYYRSIFLIIASIAIRISLTLMATYEFCRFACFHLFLAISGACAMITCLKQLANPFCKTEQSILGIYTKLRIILKITDNFLHHVVMLFIVCSQVVVTCLWWIVIKCYNILPVTVNLMLWMLTLISTLIVIILLPRAVEISDSSEKFVEFKKAMHHTYNKANKHRYYFLQWKSQRMLPIRFGTQFVINKDTPINYFNVLITSLTNAILLIHP